MKTQKITLGGSTEDRNFLLQFFDESQVENIFKNNRIEIVIKKCEYNKCNIKKIIIKNTNLYKK